MTSLRQATAYRQLAEDACDHVSDVGDPHLRAGQRLGFAHFGASIRALGFAARSQSSVLRLIAQCVAPRTASLLLSLGSRLALLSRASLSSARHSVLLLARDMSDIEKDAGSGSYDKEYVGGATVEERRPSLAPPKLGHIDEGIAEDEDLHRGLKARHISMVRLLTLDVLGASESETIAQCLFASSVRLLRH